jgi:hypothetical protein
MDQDKEIQIPCRKGHTPASPASRAYRPLNPQTPCLNATRVSGSKPKTRRRPRFTTPELMRFMPCYPRDPIDYGR